MSAEEVSIRDVNRRARTPRTCHSLPPPAAASASSAHGSLTDQPSLAAGAALGTGEAAKAIAEALKSGKVVLTKLNLFFRWSRGDCGRVAIGHVGADQAGKLSLSWNIFNWWCRGTSGVRR